MSLDSSLCPFLRPSVRPLAWALEGRPGLEEEVGVLGQACAQQVPGHVLGKLS